VSILENLFTQDDYVILHHNGRFVLYSVSAGRPIVTESFTEKPLLAYLLEFHDCEDEGDEDEAFVVSVTIDEAKERGVTGSYDSLEHCIEANTLGEGGIPISYVQFLLTYFQRGIKNVHRCEQCNEAVRIADSVSEFIGNGGELLVSHYCSHCSSFNGMSVGVI
jgi:hypothetical protein